MTDEQIKQSIAQSEQSRFMAAGARPNAKTAANVKRQLEGSPAISMIRLQTSYRN